MRALLPPGEHDAFFDAMRRPLRKSIRVNTLKISVEEFQKHAVALGWTLTPVPWCPSGFWIDRASHAIPLGKSWLHAAGLFYIQESASMLPPELLLDAATRERIDTLEHAPLLLDVAAAPGSKTTQLSALLHRRGTIVANEPLVSRIKSLSSNIERTGALNVLLARKTGEVFRRLPNTFDAILLDAPCTGEGTVRKDTSVFMRWNEKNAGKLARLQFELASAAFTALKSGGELVYSTCTLAPEENEGIAHALLTTFGDTIELIPTPHANGVTQFEETRYDPRVAGCRRLWPHREDCEGFFAAKFRKRAASEPRARAPKFFTPATRFFVVPPKRAAEYIAAIETWFGITMTIPMEWELATRTDELWLRPTTVVEKITREIPLERTGVKLAQIHRESGKIVRMTNECGMLFLTSATHHAVDLDPSQRDEYLAGRDVALTTVADDGQSVVRHAGYYLGLGLARDGKLKNQLPREFVVAG